MSNTPNLRDTASVNATDPAAPAPKVPGPEPASVPADAFALRTPWGERDYGDAIRGSGARKLASSSVAPLVAAARGYQTIQSREDLLAFRRRRLTPKRGNDVIRQQMLALAQDGEEALGMPWFRADTVTGTGTELVGMTTAQYRPSVPEMRREVRADGSEKQRAIKYLNEHGDQSVIDLHPAIPASWIAASEATASRVLIIEGLLKADAALTHLLLESGATSEQLSATGPVETTRQQLRDLLELVPPVHRTLVFALVGVGNWHNKAEWNSIDLTNRTVYVGFDGDIAENPMVWTQAQKLGEWVERKHAEPRFLRLDDPDFAMRVLNDPAVAERIGRNSDGSPKRMGLDDFLANVGSWKQALATATGELPLKPQGTQERRPQAGDFRVTGIDGTEIVEYVPITGSPIGSWETRLRLGGRVRSIESSRVPTPLELDLNTTDPELESDLTHSVCEVELNWVDENDALQTGVIRGPSSMLGTEPRFWVRDPKVRIPPQVLQHPDFPPAKHGWEFLKAVKQHRPEEVESRTGWSVMGWVPTSSGKPAFIVGRQVLAQLRSDEEDLFAGLTDEELPGASSFGVDDLYRRMCGPDQETLEGQPLDDYRKQVAADIRRVLQMFLESGAFGNRAVPVAVLGAMLRPTTPPKPQATLFFWGPPSGGKSFCAAATMSGWRSGPKVWHENRLPGQAGDTAAAAELAVSMTPIWVADDLAPSPDRSQAERQQANIDNLVRSIFNGTAKRRTEQGREMRDVNEPRALLVATAENEPRTDSVRDRAIMIEVGAGTFGPSRDRVNELRTFFESDPACPRLVAAMIRFWMHGPASQDSWRERTELGSDYLAEAQEYAREHITTYSRVKSARMTRHTKLAGELTMPFLVLRDLAIEVGIPADDPLLRRIDPSPLAEDSAVHELFRLVAGSLRRQAQSTPGTALLAALSSLLRSGGAHLANPDAPGEPPHPDNQEINTALGWRLDRSRGEGGTWVPHGPQIGYLIESTDQEEPILLALFDHRSAFKEAKRTFPDDILPGSGERAAWADMWSQQLAYGTRTPERLTTQVRPKAPGAETRGGTNRTRMRGVPVRLDALLDPEKWSHELTTATDE